MPSDASTTTVDGDGVTEPTTDPDSASVEAASDDPANTGPESTEPADDDTLDWGPVRFERLRSLAFGACATATCLILAALLVLGVAFAGSLLGGGRPASSTWAVLVVVLVGGPISLLYWLVAYGRTSPARREEFRSLFGNYSFDPSRFRLGWTLGGAAITLGLVISSLGSSPSSSFLSAFAPLLVPLLAFLPMIAGSRGTEVRLDPTAAAIERTYHTHDRTRSDDLGSVVRTRRIDLPWTGTTLFLLAYRGNAWYRSTPWLFAPTELADDVETTLVAVLERSDGPDRASVPERVVLALVGSSSLIVGVVMAVAAGEGAAGLLLALLTGPFSLLFLALAARL